MSCRGYARGLVYRVISIVEDKVEFDENSATEISEFYEEGDGSTFGKLPVGWKLPVLLKKVLEGRWCVPAEVGYGQERGERTSWELLLPGGLSLASKEASERENRKEYSRQQIASLEDLGLKRPVAVSVMKLVSPSRVQETIAFARELASKVGVNSDAVTLLACGMENIPFGFERAKAAMESLGLPTPTTYRARTFFTAIRAAEMIILAGVFDPVDRPNSNVA